MGIQEAPLTIVFWLWRDARCWTQYTPEHVNTCARMIHRNLTLAHRFVVMTDQIDAEFDPLITPIPLWDDWHDLRSPEWLPEFPQCYVRLKAFSAASRAVFGERFVSVDLDCVVTGSLDSILGRSEDFLICYRAPIKYDDRKSRYQSSMWMMNAGARKAVWSKFRGEQSFDAIRGKCKPEDARRFLSTDQGWMLYALGRTEAGWGMKDGVYFWPWLRANRMTAKLPGNAKIIFFQGQEKPWDLLDWLKANYQ